MLLGACTFTHEPAPADTPIDFSLGDLDPDDEDVLRAALLWRYGESATFFVTSDSPVSIMPGEIDPASGMPVGPARGRIMAHMPPQHIVEQLTALQFGVLIGETPPVALAAPWLVVYVDEDDNQRLTLPHPAQSGTSPDRFVAITHPRETRLWAITQLDAWFSYLNAFQRDRYYTSTGNRYTPFVFFQSSGGLVDTPEELVTEPLHLDVDALQTEGTLLCVDNTEIIPFNGLPLEFVDEGILQIEGGLNLVDILCPFSGCRIIDTMAALADFMASHPHPIQVRTQCVELPEPAFQPSVTVYRVDIPTLDCTECPCDADLDELVLYASKDNPPEGWPCATDCEFGVQADGLCQPDPSEER